MLRASVIVFPGSNCDRDIKVALEAVTGFPVNMVWHGDQSVPASDLIVLPGGFSYGDYLRAGAIARFSPVMETVTRHAEKGGLVIGICNGFQVLVKAGILPPVEDGQQLTLAGNDSNRFECRWVYLKINQQSPCIFTKGIEAMYLPIAHGEGKIMTEKATLDKLNVVVRYADAKGDIKTGYPHNPNGSVDNIAGICDATGRIFALMPHPERFISWSQHPRWTREAPRQHGDGLAIFLNAVDWVRHN